VTILDILQQADVHVQRDRKSDYILGMIGLLGDVDDLHILKQDFLLNLLSHAQIRKTRPYTLKELHQLAHTQSDDFAPMVQSLVRKGVWLEGFRAECDTCYLQAWYPKQNADYVLCSGCLSPIHIASQTVAYKLNRIVAEAVKNGALTTSLTLYLLTRDVDDYEYQVALNIR